MPEKTPFHSRLAVLNRPGIWKHWSGYLVAPRYHESIAEEYYSIRNSVSLFDTSPLFKYRFSGKDSIAFLEQVLARDIRKCTAGTAQYTVWCDENGFVIQDGVISNPGDGTLFLTAAEPALRYFRKTARRLNLTGVNVEDLSKDYGIVAVQGPHALDVVNRLSADAAPLKYFGVTSSAIAGCDVLISRTGFTGDLGYEIRVHRSDAVTVWDALIESGRDWNIMPIGSTALKMARVEAGLLLMDVDFNSSRYAHVNAQRETPPELGWGWMFRNLARDKRRFIGRKAIENELQNRTSRWTTVGLAVDGDEYESVFRMAGIDAPRHEVYREATASIYRRGSTQWDYAGYATTFLYSSLLKQPLALAKLPLDLAGPGTEVDLEINVIRKPETVLARVCPLPFFRPDRKTAMFHSDAGQSGEARSCQ